MYYRTCFDWNDEATSSRSNRRPPSLCATAIARLANVRNPFPGDPLCDPIIVQAIPSDDVCRGCATVFAGLFERAGDRQTEEEMRVGVETRLVMQQKVINEFMTLDDQVQMVDEGEEGIVLGAPG